jgi:hypothetical protein
LDVVRLTTENLLKNFAIYLEDCDDVMSTEEALSNASQSVFELYKIVREMAETHSRRVQGCSFSNLD